MQEDFPVKSSVFPVRPRRVTCLFAIIFLLSACCARAHDPDDPRGFLPKALELGAQGKFDRSAEYLAKAPEGVEKDTLEILRRLLAELDANHVQPQAAVLFFHGVVSLRAGKPEQASREFSAAAALSPDYRDTYHMLGAIASAAGRHEEAAGWWRKAVEISPSDGEAYRQLAAAYRALGDTQAAVKYALKAAAAGVDSAGIFLSLGDGYVALGQAVEAQKWYRQALRRDPGVGEAYLGIGFSYRLMGDRPRARQNFARAHKMFQARGEWAAAARAQEYFDQGEK